MIEIKCPDCNTVLEVQKNNKPIFCPNCLKNKHSKILMVETSHGIYENFGDGLFIKKKD